MYQVLQEAIDELEYCTGDANTTYGALRTTHGHPEPFQIKYENLSWFSRKTDYEAATLRLATRISSPAHTTTG